MSLTSTDRPTGSSLGELSAVGEAVGVDDFDYAVFAAPHRPASSGPTGGTVAVANPALAAALGQFRRAFEAHLPNSMFIAVGRDPQVEADVSDERTPREGLEAASAAVAAASRVMSHWVLTQASELRTIDFVIPTNIERLVGAASAAAADPARLGASAGPAQAGTVELTDPDSSGEVARVDDAVATVATLADTLGVKADDVLVAAGVKRRTFYAWKKTAGRRPRVDSQARLWELAERAEELAELLGQTSVRRWLLADPVRKKLLLAGDFDALVALASGEQLSAYLRAGGESYAQVEGPYAAGAEDVSERVVRARTGRPVLDVDAVTEVRPVRHAERDDVR